MIMKRRDFIKRISLTTAIITGAGYCVSMPIESVGPEAQVVLNKFPNPLTEKERSRVIQMVDGFVDSGAWDKMDSFMCFDLYDEKNALTNWK